MQHQDDGAMAPLKSGAGESRGHLAAAAACKVGVAATKYATNRRLASCRGLVSATGAVVGSLSKAGSELQHLVGVSTRGSILDPLLEDEDPIIRDTAQALLAACSSVSVALVSLGVALSGQLEAPLQQLQRDVETDRACRKAELAELRRRHQACSDAVTATLRQKDRVTAQMRSLQPHPGDAPASVLGMVPVHGEGSEAKSAETGGARRRSWFALPGSHRGQEAADVKLQQAAAMQTWATEEFAKRTEEMLAINRTVQARSDGLAESLGHWDVAFKQTLNRSLTSCAEAWKSTADVFSSASETLLDSAALVKAATAELVEEAPHCTSAHAIENQPEQEAIAQSDDQGGNPLDETPSVSLAPCLRESALVDAESPDCIRQSRTSRDLVQILNQQLEESASETEGAQDSENGSGKPEATLSSGRAPSNADSGLQGAAHSCPKPLSDRECVPLILRAAYAQA